MAGSNGGDAGLVAAKCVPIALGNDFAGSLRVPAAFTGTMALKITGERTSFKGVVGLLPNNFTTLKYLNSTDGPIGNRVSDLVTLFKVMIDPQVSHYDSLISPSTFNENNYEAAASGKIRVGYME